MGLLSNEKQVDNSRQEVVAKIFTVNPSETTTTRTQITNRSTAVILNSTAGQITTDTTSLAAGAEATFVVTNDKCKAKCVPVVAIASGSTGTPMAAVTAVADGSFSITYTNTHTSTAETGALVINFVLLGVE